MFANSAIVVFGALRVNYQQIPTIIYSTAYLGVHVASWLEMCYFDSEIGAVSRENLSSGF